MIPSTGMGATTGNNENEVENKDPFVVTPPRKPNSEQYTASTTPATPKSKSTPLHKRFLEEVTMSPGTSSTPPCTPTRSPIRNGRQGQTPKQMLEVGQNGFYFSMEIPEKKITPRRAATPEAKTSGRLTPSPDKLKRSEVKIGGRVKDILRKNLFGTPTKQTMKVEMEGQDTRKLQKRDEEQKMSAPKAARMHSCASKGSECELADAGRPKDAATEHRIAPFAVQDSSGSSQFLMASNSTAQLAMPSEQHHIPRTLPTSPTLNNDAAPVLSLQRVTAASTPSNIGHLMANHSNKCSKVQTLPATSGLESMPTPLRKMSERLGLRSPNVVRKDQVDENSQSDTATTSREDTLKSQISLMDVRDAAAAVDTSAAHAAVSVEEATTILLAQREHTMQNKQRLRQLLPTQITTVFPVIPSRPSTATTPSFSSPSTPSRPGLSNRAKSFGTPSRLRSSIQEDMYKMQESLKRSLGPDAFQTTSSRPTTPITPVIATTGPSPSTPNQCRYSLKKAARPISMTGSPRSAGTDSTDVVPKRRPNVAERKPRPKSMIVGSAKVLETIASQIDSPRQRAKLRSAAAFPSASKNRPTTSRPGTGATTSRASHTVVKPPALKSQPTVRTINPAVPGTTSHPKRTASPAPATHSHPPRQRTASAEAIASQISHWNKAENSKVDRTQPARRKPTKAPSQPIFHRSRPRRPKTPEPKDLKADSGTAQSYTPPGNPTRLPSPVKATRKTRMVMPGIPAAPAPSTQVKAAKVVPTEIRAKEAQTPFAKRLAVQDGDSNALRTPSKEIQNSLDAAIDRKIREDRERRGTVWL